MWQNRWFDIRELKPEEGQKVMGYFDVFNSIEVYTYNKTEHGDCFSNRTGFLTNDIIYWTPLPDAPKASYDPDFGDDRICECGHTYYRHFDPYEDMSPVGCKYCGCTVFKGKEDDLIGLGEFISKAVNRLSDMEYWWVEQNKKNPEAFPLRMSEADWDEQEMMFDEKDV